MRANLDGTGSAVFISGGLSNPSGIALIAPQPAPDCDTNGVLDECEVAASDCNTNNSLDACESCAAFTPADVNCDGAADGRDVQFFVNTLTNPGAAARSAFCAADVNTSGSVTTADVAPFACVLLGLPANCSLGFGEGEGGESMMAGGEGGGESEGSSWEPWFTWEQLRAFAQWLQANPRSAHPELTDEEYYRLWKRAMKEHGLWRE